MGFSVRKEFCNRNKKTGEVTWRKYVGCKEGFRAPDQRDYKTKIPRAETRTGCNAHTSIKLDREKAKYVVYSCNATHNHDLQNEETVHMLPSHRNISAAQAYEVDLADDSGIRLKSAHEFMGRQAGGMGNLGYTQQDHKNYLRSKRQTDLEYGEARAILDYFEKQTPENPFFYFAMQLDVEEKITNIFWADAKMIIDYGHFGDVLSFDTTYRTNKEYRPLAVFTGFNHHRETIIFGAALLYDETAASFEWLVKLASRAAECEEASAASALVGSYMNEMFEKVEDILKNIQDMDESTNEGQDSPHEAPSGNFVAIQPKGLEKKQAPRKGNKRPKSWTAKQGKKKKGGSAEVVPNEESFLGPTMAREGHDITGNPYTKTGRMLQSKSTVDAYKIVDFCWGSNDFSWLLKEKLGQMGKSCSFKNYDLIQSKMLLLVGQGIIKATGVALVEELIFRSRLPDEIATDLGYYRGIIFPGLAFSVSMGYSKPMASGHGSGSWGSGKKLRYNRNGSLGRSAMTQLSA
ncbi:hypothetical protein RHGRI_019423 [Rhododendron griersonianum]|uniref:WRKY domain-containing protein n=1 Tax=Rhododendron griersonianum TaxID=479676 RepID=A0AAV6JH06_9ERIC|nr:hypothetical protein RHGRI_019423 [Rhododendron griersonianum]